MEDNANDMDVPGMRRGSSPAMSDSWRKGDTADCPDNAPIYSSFQGRSGDVFPPNQTILCTATTRPPVSKEGKYGGYCRATSWRLQPGVSADRLMAEIGANEVGPPKWVMSDYFMLAKRDAHSRTAEGYVKAMDSRFRKSSEDLILSKLAQRGDFKKNGDDVRLFWLRFGRLQGKLRGFNVE